MNRRFGNFVRYILDFPFEEVGWKELPILLMTFLSLLFLSSIILLRFVTVPNLDTQGFIKEEMRFWACTWFCVSCLSNVVFINIIMKTVLRYRAKKGAKK